MSSCIPDDALTVAYDKHNNAFNDFSQDMKRLVKFYTNWECDLDIDTTRITYKVKIWSTDREIRTFLKLSNPSLSVTAEQAFALIVEHGTFI